MQQFIVRKASCLCEQSWSTRVLTIDTANHVLYLSQHGDVDRLDHHCMVRINKVEWWPHYSWFFHSTSYGLKDAPCTFCVEGATVHRGSSSPVSRLFRLRKRCMTAEERENCAVSGEQLSTNSISSKGSESQKTSLMKETEVHCEDQWMLRCMTRADIAPIMAALRAAAPESGCVKGEPRVALAQQT